ncbi:LacI family DNA-binding transcriptional regulator [Microlunatus flavus]|uniref:LacI family transcriptional regulator n=1 Tax=Microlunatus flavus TaxID=1036181 RepID=A0A1H9A5X9_9ACTN|nr:LacI family DNA-binding transcriptional regulator [Microlunatus flavus]SEP72100.1 LacI family transcriptional regulator [Microlunatus flavus]
MAGRPAKPRRVTMTDVARRAGVSQPTVSFVLNDRRDVAVAEDTRRRVLLAAAELDFVPNRAAQLLRSSRSYTVGIITNGIVSQPYAGRVVLGIQQVVQPADYVCIVVDTTDDPERGDKAVANLLGSGVDSIVYASPAPIPMHRSRRLDTTRTLFVNCWPDDDHVSTVILADEYHGGLAAASAAFDLGHRDVAFLGGHDGEYACVERLRGFADAARVAGVDPAGLVQRFGDYSIGAGYDLTVATMAERSPTAVVCGNDRMAIGCLLALHSLGLDCPGDVSVVGFDNQPDVADQVRPGLTTVELPHLLMGRRAGELVLQDPVAPVERMVVDCTLIRRESLGPPPVRGARRPARRASRRSPA